MCTFWDNNRWDNPNEYDEDDFEPDDCYGQDGASIADSRSGGKLIGFGAKQQSRRTHTNDYEQRRRGRRKRRSFVWRLFVLKNIFLVLFGVLGLVTGSWVTLLELGTIYK